MSRPILHQKYAEMAAVIVANQNRDLLQFLSQELAVPYSVLCARYVPTRDQIADADYRPSSRSHSSLAESSSSGK